MRRGKEGKDVLETLLARGLITPEDAATLAAKDLGPNPVRSLLASGMVDLSGGGDLGGLLEGLSRQEIAAIVPTDLEPPALAEDVGEVASWGSALAGVVDEALPEDRFELGPLVRREGPLDVHEAVEHDLARNVEVAVGPAAAVSTAANLLTEISGPGVATLLEQGRTPDGSAFLVTSAPPETRAVDLADTKSAAAALALLARVVHRAHERGVLHLGITPEVLYASEDGVVQITGWNPGTRNAPSQGRRPGSSASWEVPSRDDMISRAPELGKGREPGPEADVYSLGVVLARVARRPGSPPELRLVARRASAKRPSARYRTALALATEIERALSGEAVQAGRSPLPRRLARFGRHHPYLTLGAVFGMAALVLGLAVYLVESSRLALEKEEEAKQIRQERVASATRSLEDAKAALPRLEMRLVEEKKVALADPGAAETRRQALDDAALRARTELDQLLAYAKYGLAALAGYEDDEAARLRADLRKLALAGGLARFAADLERARREEARDYSGRTVGIVRARKETPWIEAAGTLDRLAAALGPDAPELTEARSAFSTKAWIDITALPPRGVALVLREVDDSGERWQLLDPQRIHEPGPLELEAGDWLLELTDGDRIVRHEILLAPLETYEYAPDWPSAWPPGEWAYVPASRFRAGGDAPNAGPYREERIEKGFFIAKCETTLAEYREFLRSVGAKRELMPMMATNQGYDAMLQADLSVHPGLPWYTDDMPMGGMRQNPATAYAEWKTRTGGGAWTYRLPTEEEWEAAVRGASGRIYPWGNRFDDPALDNLASYPKAGNVWFVRTGELLGRSIHDLANAAGNVREWTASEYGPGLVTIRGGWFSGDEPWARVAARWGVEPDAGRAGHGVRLLCAPPEVR